MFFLKNRVRIFQVIDEKKKNILPEKRCFLYRNLRLFCHLFFHMSEEVTHEIIEPFESLTFTSE